MPILDVNIDGHRLMASVGSVEMNTVHLVLLRDWERKWRQRGGRYVVFLAGPAGAGKTILAALWEQFSQQGKIAVPVQSLPMDGFHYPNHVLDSKSIIIDGNEMPLRRVKGRPETFDLPALHRALVAIGGGGKVSWPRYDRTAHDPIPDATNVLDAGILVVEGLFMLLDLPAWRELRSEADYGVFLECSEDVLRADLVARKHRQGRSYDDSEAHYNLVDHYVWQLTAQHLHGVNAVIRVGPGRCLELAAG